MRLATIATVTGTSAAIVNEHGVFLGLPYPTAKEAIAAEVATPGTLGAGGAPVEGTLLAPIPRPGKIFGSGINFMGHFEEEPDAPMPTEPGFFSKFPSSVVGPETDVVLPYPDSQSDYEVELAVVIGTPGKDIRPEDAFDHVFGYTVVNDVSGRHAQFRYDQKDLGKGFDTFCPMGPWIVSKEELDVADARLTAVINGELRQDASTSDWIWDIPRLVSHAAQGRTLETGDVIITGTPAGCGTFRIPAIWLQPGDDMVVAVAGIGELHNRVVAGW